MHVKTQNLVKHRSDTLTRDPTRPGQNRWPGSISAVYCSVLAVLRIISSIPHQTLLSYLESIFLVNVNLFVYSAYRSDIARRPKTNQNHRVEKCSPAYTVMLHYFLELIYVDTVTCTCISYSIIFVLDNPAYIMIRCLDFNCALTPFVY